MARVFAPFRFQADHSLSLRPERHWHQWEVEFVFRGPIDEATGVVINLIEVKACLDPIVRRLDGSYLNENAVLTNAPAPIDTAARIPTCENLARFFYWYLLCGDHRLPVPADVTLEQVRVQLEEKLEGGQGERGYATIDASDLAPELLRRRRLAAAR